MLINHQHYNYVTNLDALPQDKRLPNAIIVASYSMVTEAV